MSSSYNDSISGYSGGSRALSSSGLSSYSSSSATGASTARYASSRQVPSRSADDASSDHARSISSHSGIGTMASTGATSVNTSAALYLQAGLLEAHWSRRFTFSLVTSNIFGSMILSVILLNTAVLAIQSTPFVSMNYGWYLSLLDQVFLGIYLMETLSKLFVFRWTYFKNSWNMFDFIIVLTSVVTFALTSLSVSLSSFNPQIVRLFRIFRTLRAIRSLRALRAISFLKSLQIIVEALLSSLPAMSSIIALAGLTLYIFSVIARASYATYDPRRFGTLGSTFFWLFSTLTLDEWTRIWLENPEAPGIFIFLFIFMVLETFVFLNLFVAVIVSNLDASRSRMDRLRRRDARIDRGGLAGPPANAEAPGGQVTFQTMDTGPAATGSLDHELIEPAVSLHQAIADLLDPLPGVHQDDAVVSASPTDLYYSPAKCIRDKLLLARVWQLLAVLEHEHAHLAAQCGITDSLMDLLTLPQATGAAAAAAGAESAVKRRMAWRKKSRDEQEDEDADEATAAKEDDAAAPAAHMVPGITARAASALGRRTPEAEGGAMGKSPSLGPATSLVAFLSNSLRPSFASVAAAPGSRPTSAARVKAGSQRASASHTHLGPSEAHWAGSSGVHQSSGRTSRSSRERASGAGGSAGMLAQAVATAFLQQQQQQQQQQMGSSRQLEEDESPVRDAEAERVMEEQGVEEERDHALGQVAAIRTSSASGLDATGPGRPAGGDGWG